MSQIAIPELKSNTLIFLSDNDQVASSKMTATLFKDKDNTRIIYHNQSNHIILYDHNADETVESIVDFLLDSELRLGRRAG